MPRIDLEEIQRRLDANLPKQNAPQQNVRKSGSESLPSNHPLWELWQRMNEIYGHQWASQQGDDPNDTWIRGLDGLSNKQFGSGLRALLTRDETWPPNLVEFRQLCTGQDPGAWERQAHRIYEPERRLVDLTAKEAARAAGEETLAELRELFT